VVGTVNGVTNGYAYDTLGRMTTVLANGSPAAGYTFDAVGNLQTLRYGNGVTNVYQYDARNRLTNLVWNTGGSVLASFGYTLGATGSGTAAAEAVNGLSRTCTWNYDYLHRWRGEGRGHLGQSIFRDDWDFGRFLDAVGERGTGIGAVHADDAGGQPDGARAGEKTGITKTTAAQYGEKRDVEKSNCHYFADPFTW